MLGTTNIGRFSSSYPGISMMGQSFNVFKGIPLGPRAPGTRIINFTYNEGYSVNLDKVDYKFPDQLSQPPSGATCNQKSYESSIYNTQSTKSLESQNDESSFGFDQKSKVSMELPLGGSGAKLGAEAEIENALMFGNSNASATTETTSKSVYTYSYTLGATATLAVVRGSWNRTKLDYDTYFIKELDKVKQCDINDNAAINKSVFKLFRDFGSHVIAEGVFGAKAYRTCYMGGNVDVKAIQDFKKDVDDDRWSILGMIKGGDTKTTISQSEQTSTSDVRYKYSGLNASGQVKQPHCPEFKGDNNEPSLISYKLLPVWDLDVVDPETKARITKGLDSFCEYVSSELSIRNGYLPRIDIPFWDFNRIENWNGVFRDSDMLQWVLMYDKPATNAETFIQSSYKVNNNVYFQVFGEYMFAKQNAVIKNAKSDEYLCFREEIKSFPWRPLREPDGWWHDSRLILQQKIDKELNHYFAFNLSEEPGDDHHIKVGIPYRLDVVMSERDLRYNREVAYIYDKELPDCGYAAPIGIVDGLMDTHGHLRIIFEKATSGDGDNVKYGEKVFIRLHTPGYNAKKYYLRTCLNYGGTDTITLPSEYAHKNIAIFADHDDVGPESWQFYKQHSKGAN